MTERNFYIPVRMPEDVYEQLRYIPDIKKRSEISKALFEGLSTLLTSNGAVIDWEKSGARPPKTISRIEDKIIRRNSTDPARDIYGVRFVTEEADRAWFAKLIQSAYPSTPNEFPGGKPSVRDYRKPEIRSSHIERLNPHMSPQYSAMHINFVFQREGSDLLDIGEVQIMTSEEYEIYKKTRNGYSNAYSLDSRDQTSENSWRAR